MSYRKTTDHQRKPQRKGDEGYDPYDFERGDSIRTDAPTDRGKFLVFFISEIGNTFLKIKSLK